VAREQALPGLPLLLPGLLLLLLQLPAAPRSE
jgi:hypothetical protein